MRLCYIAAPLSGRERERNRARAARWVAWAARQGVAPVATWVVLAGQWDETEDSRALGLAIDCATVARCDELWLVGGHVSPGMAVERAAAERVWITVRDLTGLGEEPPDLVACGKCGGSGELLDESALGREGGGQ